MTFVGFAIAAIFAIFEFLYGTKLSGGDAGVTWLQEMITDLRYFLCFIHFFIPFLRFIFLCHGNTMKIARSRTASAFASSSMEWNTSSDRSSSWFHSHPTTSFSLSFFMSITYFMKGITSTDTKPSSRDGNTPDESGKEKGVLTLEAQNQEPFRENNDEEHPYELPSTR